MVVPEDGRVLSRRGRQVWLFQRKAGVFKDELKLNENCRYYDEFGT